MRYWRLCLLNTELILNCAYGNGTAGYHNGYRFHRSAGIPAKVERVACLYAFSGHAVTMLGKSSTIVAVNSGLSRDILLNEIAPNIKKALIPSSSGAINIEELLNAKPDIAFISGDTAQNEGEVEKLRKAKIPYLVVD